MLATAASAIVLLAVVAWWIHVFRAPAPHAPVLPAPAAPIDVQAGATLFGAQPEQRINNQIQVLGVLAFDAKHAAAVISVGDGPAKVVHVNGAVDNATTLSEVRAHSVVVEHNNVRREIPLAAVQNADVFMH
ncbi:hypothetical protein GCM10027093_63300 [Paraburkholderia jirisanensis]